MMTSRMNAAVRCSRSSSRAERSKLTMCLQPVLCVCVWDERAGSVVVRLGSFTAFFGACAPGSSAGSDDHSVDLLWFSEVPRWHAGSYDLLDSHRVAAECLQPRAPQTTGVSSHVAVSNGRRQRSRVRCGTSRDCAPA